MKKLAVIATVASILSMTGCASIIGDENQNIDITSTPSHAHVAISDESQKDVFEGETPTTVSLDKSNGHYWGKKSYKLVISKNGYAPKTVDITAHANGWYIGGNIIFGGFIGWFAVDPFNGKMYTLSPDHIDASLGEKSTAENDGKSGLHVVLLQDIPANKRDQLKYIGTAS